MRIVAEIKDPRVKISVFSFNERWLAKFELGLCEITLKAPHDEMDLDELKSILETPKIKETMVQRLTAMNSEWFESRTRKEKT